ncbi:MAG: TetR/AcrR family transcriptional regulator [Myxococcota bacterium]
MKAGSQAGGVRQQQKAQTRAALLAAARRVLQRRGFGQTTTREIAEEAGVAAGTFFVHFPDLGALVEALLDEHLGAVLEGALKAALRRKGLVAQLSYVARQLYESYDVEPELSRAYLTGSLFPARSGGQMTTRLQSFSGWVVERIDAAVKSGAVPEIDRALAFSAFFSLYFGILVAGLSGMMPRKQQLAFLEASLRRLFLLEDSV